MEAAVGRIDGRLLVGGRRIGAAGGATFAVHDPATGAVLCSVADAAPADAIAALDAACAAGGAWAATAPRDRAAVLRRACEEVEARAEELALVITLEMGKPLAESRAEVAYAADFLRWFSEEAVRVGGRAGPSPDGATHTVVGRRPVGPCLLVTPWNFPLAMGARKLGPALAAGCPAIVKPAEQTPLATLALGDILQRAGAPSGVVNILTTSEPAPLVEALLADGRLRKLSFTGSSPVGRALHRRAAEVDVRVSLELGGNAPFLVFDDADLEDAVAGALVAKLRNTGEACTAANRFIVAEPLAEPFTRRLAEAMDALQVGPGTDPGTDIGPLIDATACERVEALVADAVGAGARVRTRRRTLASGGHFTTPVVLDRVPPEAELLHQELFAPVAPVLAVRGEAEAVRLANATPYGLAAYLYSRDIRRALRVAEALEAGMVAINQGMVSNVAAPFGGIKASGIGREGGSEGIEEYLHIQTLAIAR